MSAALRPASPPAIPGLAAAVAAVTPGMIPADRARWVAALAEPMARAGITSPRRMAAFIGQCAHESGGFRSLVENLSYSADRLCAVWPSRFPSVAAATPFARNPEKLANRVYSGRLGNGPEASGDGWRFRGRGLIQLTGRANYAAFGASVGRTADDVAEWCASPEGAAASAVYFWSVNGLNDLAASWQLSALSRRINGGSVGLDHRIACCTDALAAINREVA